MTGTVSRRLVRTAGLVGLGLAAAALAACAGDEGPSASPDRTVRVQAGGNDRQDPSVTVLEYLPGSVTVAAGATVEWRFPGPEPHSVTFFPAGRPAPPPGSDPALSLPTPPTGPFDGASLVNSGVSPGAPFRVRFPDAGSFAYVCVIHPGMTGRVTVVGPGAKADDQAAVDSRAQAERARWTDEGRAARLALDRTSPRSEQSPDGTTTWRIEMGATTEHTAVLAFSPTEAEVRPGDRVVFVNDGGRPHTATFAGPLPLPPSPASPEVATPAPGPSPQVLTAGHLFGTGILPPNAPPGPSPAGPGPLSPAPLAPAGGFTFVLPAAGTYSYVCVLHRASGMAGSVKVA